MGATDFAGTTEARGTRTPHLRVLALPTEHGGWGLLIEPLILGVAVRPSFGGALLAVAFVFGFLTRQPLRLALQDALRGKAYPRTRWCWLFVTAYALAAATALGFAIAIAGWTIVIPIGLVVPLGLTQVLYDAHHRSRALLPELGGAAAMASSAAAIAIAGGMRILPALALSGVIVARSIPSIVYVRTLLQRAHGQRAAAWPALTLHAIAALAVAWFSFKLAVVAMALLFARAAWGLSRPAPPAKRIGWTEIVWGVVTVALVVLGATRPIWR